jgi:titin
MGPCKLYLATLTGIALALCATTSIAAARVHLPPREGLGSEHLSAPVAKIVVTNTNDVGVGSLRLAIDIANASAEDDVIQFDIPKTDPGFDTVHNVWVIQPGGSLPMLLDDKITIDGYTQEGAQPASGSTPALLTIAIDGSSAGDTTAAFMITSSGNRIKGLVIQDFDNHGICIVGTGATGNIIAGNHIGTDATGTSDAGNGDNGILIEYGANLNYIGGRSAADRNIISGNEGDGVWIGTDAMTNTVAGNYIGLTANGATGLANTRNGVNVVSGTLYNVIGGDSSLERNVISGNGQAGVKLASSGTMSNTVSGNRIGTNRLANTGVGNGTFGVLITGTATHNAVGGDTSGERNVVSGNGEGAIAVLGAGTTDNEITGNYIGTNGAGSSALPNAGSGVLIGSGAQHNTVGGGAVGQGNLISGNGDEGVRIAGAGSTGNVVLGNIIGTRVGGTAGLGNAAGVAIVDGANDNQIGGPGAGEGNLISGNSTGIRITGAGTASNTVHGNLIGTDLSGTAPIPNLDPLIIGGGAQYNLVGGLAPGEANVISANSYHGVYLVGADTMSNTVAGNFIGTDASATLNLGNGAAGVNIKGGASNNTIGPGNVIAHNTTWGVWVRDTDTVGNRITQNSIFDNAATGIHLAVGAHGDIAQPVISETLPGSIVAEGIACAGCTVEVFINSDTDGEGETYLAQGLADGAGIFSIDVGSLADEPYLTATATDVLSGTSEFSSVFESTVRGVFLPLVVVDA